MAKYIREDMKLLPGLVQKARTSPQGQATGQEQAQPKQLPMF
jgi:hypothetical protein